MTVLQDEWRVCRVGYSRKRDTLENLRAEGFEVVDTYDVTNTHAHEELTIVAVRNREAAVA